MEHTVFSTEHITLGDAGFVARAITSHLQVMWCVVVCGHIDQTGGCTVVYGVSDVVVNVLINSLALFLTPDERRRVRRVVAGHHNSYSPDLLLQGILAEVGVICGVNDEID